MITKQLVQEMKSVESQPNMSPTRIIRPILTDTVVLAWYIELFQISWCEHHIVSSLCHDNYFSSSRTILCTTVVRHAVGTRQQFTLIDDWRSAISMAPCSWPQSLHGFSQSVSNGIWHISQMLQLTRPFPSLNSHLPLMCCLSQQAMEVWECARGHFAQGHGQIFGN